MMITRSTGILSASVQKDALVRDNMYYYICVHMLTAATLVDIHAHHIDYVIYCSSVKLKLILLHMLLCCHCVCCINTGDSCEFKHELCNKCAECDSKCSVKKHWWRGKSASCKCSSDNKSYDDKTKRSVVVATA
jgi:hypothetical protein